MLYRIENRESGHVLGTWWAESEEEALDAMARDAGYRDAADADEEVGGGDALAVVELALPVYGIAEIALALGESQTTIAKRVERGSMGMPPPDWTISAGHIWKAATIEPWIKEQLG